MALITDFSYPSAEGHECGTDLSGEKVLAQRRHQSPTLRHMHTGDRSAPAVDAGGVLPGCQGIIVATAQSIVSDRNEAYAPLV
jgi:hypothetical protein